MMDKFDRNITFSYAMRNVAKAIERMRDGLAEQNAEDSELLIEYETMICDDLLGYLEDYLPHYCDDEEEGVVDDEEEN